MKEFFEKQLKHDTLTEDNIGELHNKTYFNGEEIQVGDVILFAMLMSEVIDKEGEIPELPMKIIILNERHFNLFEYDERLNKNNDWPIIKFPLSN